ncbi:prepilin-type N-terminal cleavage/methylation domain-containing protein [Mobilisporobacter senegalensis]|uniref:Prepilin-type N-terminal cleavage/methylation domain-containing protein n=1 Tax=Mobilisporobacter senegalensis TaxID=1329262 RepID=A0A3N1XVK3_9FIRM|nr:prepilin-type N-terminal cleavage/methylation domain-containing protein [Mobilisporobacter senegalensis]ROR30643.1 prepilin-type N-terminal cleavage/methylation domain-containing protein [Mobilisporobacter senegalensis]
MRRIEKDHTGFTLIELLVSISISALVMLSLVYIINYSTRNYRNASAEVSLQTEAQMMLNQMSDLIIEAYNVKYDPSGILTLYHEDYKYLIILDSLNQQLNFEKYYIGGDKIGNTELLGRYVTSFQVTDTGDDDDNSQIKISLSLKNGRNMYEIKDQLITLRNQIKPVP